MSNSPQFLSHLLSFRTVLVYYQKFLPFKHNFGAKNQSTDFNASFAAVAVKCCLVESSGEYKKTKKATKKEVPKTLEAHGKPSTYAACGPFLVQHAYMTVHKTMVLELVQQLSLVSLLLM